MAIMKIEYHSEALDMSRQVTVLYPDRNRVENPMTTTFLSYIFARYGRKPGFLAQSVYN